MSEIAVIGAGAWGTSLAIVLGAEGHAPRPPVGPRKRSARFHLHRAGSMNSFFPDSHPRTRFRDWQL